MTGDFFLMRPITFSLTVVTSAQIHSLSREKSSLCNPLSININQDASCFNETMQISAMDINIPIYLIIKCIITLFMTLKIFNGRREKIIFLHVYTYKARKLA